MRVLGRRIRGTTASSEGFVTVLNVVLIELNQLVFVGECLPIFTLILYCMYVHTLTG